MSRERCGNHPLGLVSVSLKDVHTISLMLGSFSLVWGKFSARIWAYILFIIITVLNLNPDAIYQLIIRTSMFSSIKERDW